jgi:hypothetical protein
MNPVVADIADTVTAMQLAQYDTEDAEKIDADLASMVESELLEILSENSHVN